MGLTHRASTVYPWAVCGHGQRGYGPQLYDDAPTCFRCAMWEPQPTGPVLRTRPITSRSMIEGDTFVLSQGAVKKYMAVPHPMVVSEIAIIAGGHLAAVDEHGTLWPVDLIE